MGIFYKYKCKNCDYEETFYVGGGMFSFDYYEECKQLQKEFREECISGKLGETIRALFEADKHKSIGLSCGTELYQCLRCKCIKIWHEKRIYGRIWEGNPYDVNIEIVQKCPECGDDFGFKKLKGKPLVCPKCKEMSIEEAGGGLWD